jgi:hypothetical protein
MVYYFFLEFYFKDLKRCYNIIYKPTDCHLDISFCSEFRAR